MTSDDWQRVKELVASALELEPDKRADFVQQACGDDLEISQEVESLLAAHQQEDSFMESPAVSLTALSLVGDSGESLIGKHIGPYEILRELGRGGMGDVYLARDGRLRRHVALKLLPKHFTIDVERVRRFEQEAQAASALNHPNILTIHEIGRSDSIHFIATEFIDGMTLRDRVAGASARAAGNGSPLTGAGLELSEALDIATQIASALTSAHEAGIVHRDIKPDNVMLRRDGFVKVLDFGLAKLTSDEVTTVSSDKLNTHPGMVMGTVQYMSPEQARGQEVDQRSDIWSLGVVLYEMVTGNVPFSGETPSHIVVSILEDQPSQLDQKGYVPEELEQIVAKALRKNREERYQSAAGLARDLKTLKQDLEVKLALKHSSESAVAEPHTSLISGDGSAVEVTHSRLSSLQYALFHPASSAEYLLGEIKRHKRRAALAAIALIMVFATLTYAVYSNNGGGDDSTSGEVFDSLVVLPFLNESGDANTEHVAHGITESVINSLSHVPKLKVISHSAVMPYRGKQTDPRSMGQTFNVTAVLTGRIMQQGDDLAISAELVDARDNRRLWGHQYKRKLSDILFVQEEIAQKISDGLHLRLTGEQKKRLGKRYTQDPEAYLFYTLGKYSANKNTKEGLEQSIEHYQKAINLDPKYALAYAALSNAYHQLEWRGFWIPREGLIKSEWAALKAVELDEVLSEARVAAGLAKHRRWDLAGAEEQYKRALELDPNSVEANRRYAQYLAYHGRANEALSYAQYAERLGQPSSGSSFLALIYLLARQYDAAIELNSKLVESAPDRAQLRFFLGEAYVANGMYKEGIAELERAVALDNEPERWDRHPVLAHAYALAGRRVEALKILEEQKRLAKQRYIPNYNFAIIYSGLGELDLAFEFLNKAYDDGFPLLQLPSRPMFDNLRSDPRYTALLERLSRPR